MSALQWRDWSCTVRVVVADGRPASRPPEPLVAAEIERIVRSLMGDVERAVSRFRTDSDLMRVNANPGLLVPVRPLTVDLLDVALESARRTDGACDPTVGAHVLAVGYDADIDVVRHRIGTRVAAVPRDADWTAVRVDRSLGRVGVPRGLRLDLGATAKAWTADEAARRVTAQLGLPGLVAIGGDLAVAGRGPCWPVLVAEREGEAGQELALDRGGLATSSTTGRRWTTSGEEQHHLIDPATGRPTQGPLRTASVWAASCLEANTLSTAALVWGGKAVGRLGVTAARLVDRDGCVTTTRTWPRTDVAA